MPAILLIHIRLDSPRGNGIDGDFPRPRINREAAREGLHGGFGARVKGVVGDAGHVGCDGGGEDDAAAMGEVPEGVLRDEELASCV